MMFIDLPDFPDCLRVNAPCVDYARESLWSVLEAGL